MALQILCVSSARDARKSLRDEQSHPDAPSKETYIFMFVGARSYIYADDLNTIYK